ncbi:MAG: hypothetical protein MK135_07380, partial [Polyangiaceae bacterium]|nr:hypothetical protein [Polyangiaceae bacterium]
MLRVQSKYFGFIGVLVCGLGGLIACFPEEESEAQRDGDSLNGTDGAVAEVSEPGTANGEGNSNGPESGTTNQSAVGAPLAMQPPSTTRAEEIGSAEADSIDGSGGGSSEGDGASQGSGGSSDGGGSS